MKVTSLPIFRVIAVSLLLAILLAHDIAAQESATITLFPDKDNTLIEDADGSMSNGAADSFYAGRVGANGNRTLRRAVFHFDMTSLPENIEVLSATLSLHVTLPERSDPISFKLHRVTQDWGEGTSSFTGGVGAPSTESDATWIHTFYEESFWNSPGGDFIESPSATLSLGGAGTFVFNSTPEMLEDINYWYEHPEENFGWILLGDESGPSFTVKQISSRESRIPEDRPTLTIEYIDPALPVELTLFEGFADGTAIHLRWLTSSELNNAGFQVEHKQSDSFAPIGFIPGNGTTNEPQDYTYTLQEMPAGVHSFRLKQIDFDGTFAYSPIIEVQSNLQDRALLNVYPSPFNPRTSILFYTQQQEYVQIQAFNALGEEIATIHEGSLSPGTQHRFYFEPNDLPSGLYWIRAKGALFSLTRSVVYVK